MDLKQIKVPDDSWPGKRNILLLKLKPEGLAGAFVSSCIACGFIFLFFGFAFVQGNSVFWRTEVDDVTQYVAGFNFFFTSPWQNPLLAFDALNYPRGTLVTFVDAIPLYSIILKLLIPQAWAPFNPYGFWVTLCFLLQAIGAWWIARELKASSWVFLLTLVCLLLSFPAFLARLSHTSLMSHWLLLFALALYLKSRRSEIWPTQAWSILCLVAFYVNIYLFTMVCGVFGCAWLSATQHRALVRVRALLWPIALLAVTAYFAMWPLPSGKPMSEWGFGFYSMNILSPWVGGYILPSVVSWLGLGPTFDFFTGGPGQSEGFNYLGLGVVMLLCWSGSSILKRIKDHKSLSAMLLILCIYALSNQVWFGSLVVIDLKYPGFLVPLTSQFRASGRFFWLVGYVLLVFVLYKTYQRNSPKLFASIACGVMLLQVIDLNRVYKELSSKLNHEQAQIIHADQWDAALGSDSKVLYVYPKFKCGKDHQKSVLPLMKYASERNLKLNTGYIARYTPDCSDMKEEIANSNPEISAYVIVQDFNGDIVKLETFFPASWPVRCQFIDFANVCRVNSRKAIQ